jgi:MSHA biogenesis protein MshI
VYVVVAKSDEVETLAELLHDAGLKVEAIDIAEMAIRNLALHLDRPGRPRAYLQLQPGQTIIEISDGSQIFLSRRVMQDYDENSDAELLQAQMENLALEVQRSLDYFESQYALGPADRLSVMIDSDAQFEAFAGVARTFLTVQTERFSLAGMETSENVDLGSLDHGITAVGAAMRGLPRAA